MSTQPEATDNHDATLASLQSRRNFVRGALAAAAGVASIPLTAVAASAQSISASPGLPPAGYGSLAPVPTTGVNGMSVLDAFTVRVIAESGRPIGTTGLTFRGAPDGAATFPDGSGGWYYTVNHELSNGNGGVTSIRFNSAGDLIGAQSILSGTNRNCAGGPTPWNTWLSCEENAGGATRGQTSQIWECWPDGSNAAVNYPQMGTRNHEAVAVDPVNEVLYITEDRSTGKLWRYTPTTWPNLATGTLERAQTSIANGTGDVTWVSSGGRNYNGGEGLWFHPATRKVYMATKGDDSIWELDTAATPNRMERVWQGSNSSSSPLYEPDNVTVADASGDLFVAEDDGQLRVVLITAEGALSTFVQFDKSSGSEHSGSEVTGPVFNPAGDRMYVSSQRGGPNGNGITYEVSGPFRGSTGYAQGADPGNALTTAQKQVPAESGLDGTRTGLVAGATAASAAMFALRNRTNKTNAPD